jgi:hypothetical protein
MKLQIRIIVALFLLVVMGACQDYNQLANNPNLPTSVPPSLLLTGALQYMNDQNAWDGKQGSMSAAQFYVSTYDYYGTNNYDQEPFIKTRDNFEYTSVLQNLVQMDIESKKVGKPDVNPYGAIGKFLKAYYFNLMSQKLGDIPFSEALTGADNPNPKYDTQKDVYKQILALLDESNADLTTLIAASDGTLTGDIFLGNDLKKWQKVVNSFTLRVLISLSKKEADADLAIKTKFAAIVNDPAKYPVMTSLSDNLQYTFNASYNPYPKNPTSLGRDGTRENVASALLDLTTTLKDPRTFVVATPAPALLANVGGDYTDFAAYAGAPAGLGMGALGTNAQGGQYSYVNALRYSYDFAGSKAEPAIIIGYPELCFNIAEGINRGWAAGNAGTWYTNGIVASMTFLGLSDGASVTVGNLDGKTIYGSVSVSVSNYLAQASVQYQGGAAGLTQILQQKYIAFWQNSNWEAFFNQRRTGVPTFSEGVGSGNGNKIAKRWQYPRAEADANSVNYNAAVQSQYAGADDLNGVMWILQ